MSPELVISIVQNALYILIIVSAPVLLTSLLVGLLVSVLQAATQINEMTLTFIPSCWRCSWCWCWPVRGC
ncbi:Flagellar biosynthetic protein FliQ [Chromobacterium violaceum]|uniref:Flagellar biosynthetic protein FliQ n=1 Tax=Chromobacterium violaceum TaxID=536 RepID=A0A447TGQ4_CHRVL|nr:Flagellar biosynthetic protein FliQ [Chromobacterium violaceum]